MYTKGIGDFFRQFLQYPSNAHALLSFHPFLGFQGLVESFICDKRNGSSWKDFQ
jgi:hypothetical protein